MFHSSMMITRDVHFQMISLSGRYIQNSTQLNSLLSIVVGLFVLLILISVSYQGVNLGSPLFFVSNAVTSVKTTDSYSLQMNFTCDNCTPVLVGSVQRNVYVNLDVCDAHVCKTSKQYDWQGQGPEWGYSSNISNPRTAKSKWFVGVFSPSASVLFQVTQCTYNPNLNQENCYAYLFSSSISPASWTLPNGTIIHA